MRDEPRGLDLIDWRPDYTKSAEENLSAYREAYRKVFGEYPPPPSREKTEDAKE